MKTDRLIGGILILAIVVLVAVGLWRIGTEQGSDRVALVSRPHGVMGTSCTVAAITSHPQRTRAEEGLEQAEIALRAVEARMSTWLADSEISHLNAAAPGTEVPLSPDTLEVLTIARDAAGQTQGAFDVTCRPLVELWRRAAQCGSLPTQRELAAARAASGWQHIELTDRGAIRRAAGAGVDLGGIAKGYAIDRAGDVLRRAGLSGGLVDVGGDLLCFGKQAASRVWPVEVNNPFGTEPLAQLQIPGGAVCTSGGYARFVEIAGRRYSHIVDPRSGRPANVAASVTVVAPSAVVADIWATALGVDGPEGFDKLPRGVEALVVVGSKDDYRILCTPGFHALLEEPVPEKLSVWSDPDPAGD